MGSGETLTPMPQPTVSTPAGTPAGIAVSLDGKSVYVSVFDPTAGERPASRSTTWAGAAR